MRSEKEIRSELLEHCIFPTEADKAVLKFGWWVLGGEPRYSVDEFMKAVYFYSLTIQPNQTSDAEFDPFVRFQMALRWVKNNPDKVKKILAESEK